MKQALPVKKESANAMNFNNLSCYGSTNGGRIRRATSSFPDRDHYSEDIETSTGTDEESPYASDEENIDDDSYGGKYLKQTPVQNTAKRQNRSMFSQMQTPNLRPENFNSEEFRIARELVPRFNMVCKEAKYMQKLPFFEGRVWEPDGGDVLESRA